MKQILSMVVMLVATTLFTSTASAECLMYISSCPKYPSYQGVSFYDGYKGAAINPKQCLARAKDFQTWCETHPTGYAAAYFITQGVYSIAEVVSGNSRVKYAIDKAGRSWIALD